MESTLQTMFDDSYDLRMARSDPERFREQLDGFLCWEDSEVESYPCGAYQRDMSVQFTWGHDHRFSNDLVLAGRMGNRHITNLLSPGGCLLLETAIAGRLKYQGAKLPGWNWLIPDAATLDRWLEDVGFVTYETIYIRDNRALLLAWKDCHRDMLQAGLSRRMR